MKPIEELNTWDLECVYVHDGSGVERMPATTPQNMLAMLNKINELVQAQNSCTSSCTD